MGGKKGCTKKKCGSTQKVNCSIVDMMHSSADCGPVQPQIKMYLIIKRGSFGQTAEQHRVAGGAAVCLPIYTCCAEYPPTCTAGTDRQIDISPPSSQQDGTRRCLLSLQSRGPDQGISYKTTVVPLYSKVSMIFEIKWCKYNQLKKTCEICVIYSTLLC